MSKFEQKYAPSLDAQAPDIDSVGLERVIKVYPYALPNAEKSRAFIQGNSITIAAITQNVLEKSSLISEITPKDEEVFYFEAVPDVVINTILDDETTTSTYGKHLIEEPQFSMFSNFFPETLEDKIQLGANSNVEIFPMVFTIGAPYDRDKYEAGKQHIYISTNIVEALADATSGNYINYLRDKKGAYSFDMINLTNIEQQYTDVEILFDEDPDFNLNPTIFSDNNVSGITIGFERNTLIGGIKGKGRVVEQVGGLREVNSEDIDFYIDNKDAHLFPIKMSPISTQDKLTMNIDWFDYDKTLPYFAADYFKTPQKLDFTPSGGTPFISHPEDIKLIEDMLLYSYMFASEFADVPVLLSTNVGDAGKLDPRWGVGEDAVSVAKLSGKDPMKVVDGLWEKHIRRYPDFISDKTRVQPVSAIINSLSRFITSSHSIGGGQNAFAWAYLPWFLHPVNGIVVKTATRTATQDNPVTSMIVLDKDQSKFQTKSLFYSTKFSNKIPYSPEINLPLPEKAYLSNLIQVQTDNKITLPELPYILTPVNKSSVVGSIATNSSSELQNVLWGQQVNPIAYKKILMDTPKTDNVIPAGTHFTHTLNHSPYGKLGTLAEANAELARLFPDATIDSEPTLTTQHLPYAETVNQINNSVHEWNPENQTKWPLNTVASVDAINDTLVFKSDKEIIDILWTVMGWNKKGWLKDDVKLLDKPTYDINYSGGVQVTLNGKFQVEVPYTIYSPAGLITTKATGGSVDYELRETIYDKTNWTRMLDKTDHLSIFQFPTIYHDVINVGNPIKLLEELTIQYVWGDSMILELGNRTIIIPLFAKDDETITTQKIIFT